MIDIRTGREMTRGGFLKGILAAGIAPAIVGLAGPANASVGRGMMRGVGARLAAMGGGVKDDNLWTWPVGAYSGGSKSSSSVWTPETDKWFANVFTGGIRNPNIYADLKFSFTPSSVSYDRSYSSNTGYGPGRFINLPRGSYSFSYESTEPINSAIYQLSYPEVSGGYQFGRIVLNSLFATSGTLTVDYDGMTCIYFRGRNGMVTISNVSLKKV